MKLLAFVVALVCIVLAVLYWFGLLQLGASTPGPHHKHALVFAVIAVVALLFSRFQSGAATPNPR